MAQGKTVTVLPRNFHHPYTPYEIQLQFMNAVYSCLEDGKVAILESPTGTGKSLSLICGSLTWLRNHKRKEFEEDESTANDENEPSWIVEYAQRRRREAAAQKLSDLKERLDKIREGERRQLLEYQHGEIVRKKRKIESTQHTADTEPEARFALDDYESDEENGKTNPVQIQNSETGFSATTQELMKRLGMPIGEKRLDEEDVDDGPKIYFCSRTHSQLTQFAEELRRVKLPAGIPPEPNSESASANKNQVELEEEVRHLTLGSRRNLCINPAVSKLRSPTAINEKCLDLQQPGASKCPFLPTKEDQVLVHEFRDHVMANVRDIEDMGVLGKKLGICPYYASRSSIPPSEIITLPYPLLLQKSARESLDINLKGNVVIIDEAHNLMDAISAIYSTTISHSVLKRARTQLAIYLQKFRNRLKGKNRVYVTQVVRLMDSITVCLEKKDATLTGQDGIAQLSDLMAGKGTDQINLYKLVHYLHESKLARKVDGYTSHEQQQAGHVESKHLASSREPSKGSRATDMERAMPALSQFQAFLLALTNPSGEGRIFFIRTEDGEPSFRYMLLDPTHHFREVVEEARAVILAGGTMSPMSDYMNHLFNYLPKERLETLSCGHVIPSENLVAWPVAKGPSGLEFDFTFEKRKEDNVIDELGRAILNLCLVIPDGVVAFFPSYAYLESVIQRWQKQIGANKSIWERLSARKEVFTESKGSASVDEVLQSYSTSITNGRGGLLFSVVGGKLSEGINFSDRLGRGVIAVGLPFPNAHSAEWKAKLEYVQQSALQRGESKEQAKLAAREVYENACMRAVNQSIGRAIRHKNDYAAIVLLDKRFNLDRIQGKLPGWIREGLIQDGISKPFNTLMSSVSTFFRSKKI
ncbi:ATP-dependent RNA helicase CHL1 [Xylona heveae TC161]|uniref:ATP-dependent DNA helicase CHL1 n=1 Tax=Xylona heveae (strain CBS 132557 / TC161) TaxID=1328760 RepID=A0A165G6Y9_XYLHT|nr:ATP-dependent RNA helicase CHL1 [Xylona heveae TC161]KZF21810.1 ATP-dependent RNA helicase CHL1 [Xylona heveae TC161]